MNDQMNCPSNRPLRLGMVLNPYAGIGGPSAFKGSDAKNIQQRAKEGKLPLTCPARAKQFLTALAKYSGAIEWVTARGAMGSSVLQDLSFNIELLEYSITEDSTAEDTKKVVRSLLAKNIDLLIFMGGDGTARDVCSVLKQTNNNTLPALGIPAGVKMHSGVYAVNPIAGAELIKNILHGQPVSLVEREVRDIDESALDKGLVKSRYFGDILVPEDNVFVQQVKQGGGEEDELSLLDIASEIKNRIDETENGVFIFGPGSTTHAILNDIGIKGTLLGVDIISNGELTAADVNGAELESFIQQYNGPVKLIITAIGGQGHLIGRGNQQLTIKILKTIGRENLWPVVTRKKLNELNGRPLLMDSGSDELDKAWRGLIPVISGYNEQCLYRVDCIATFE